MPTYFHFNSSLILMKIFFALQLFCNQSQVCNIIAETSILNLKIYSDVRPQII